MIPLHERRILEAFIRNVSLSQLVFEERALNEYEEKELRNLIKQRINGMPLQYLTGTQAFYGRDFYINTQVLIPRPETEGLIEKVLEKLPNDSQSVGLDFGTGSGCIALTLAIERNALKIFAADCSLEALEVAKENTRKFKKTNVEFLHVFETPSLWQFEELPELDFLVSNPPYLLQEDEIAEDVRKNEPEHALFSAENDPLYFYRFLLELMQKKVKQGGFAAFEVPHNRSEKIAALFKDAKLKCDILKDLTDRPRYLIVSN